MSKVEEGDSLNSPPALLIIVCSAVVPSGPILLGAIQTQGERVPTVKNLQPNQTTQTKVGRETQTQK